MSSNELAEIFATPHRNIRFLKVVGTGMVPLLEPGQWVAVDTSEDEPRHHAVYALHIAGGIDFKHLMADGRTRTVKVISEAAWCVTYEVPLDKLEILGRVVGRFVRM